MTKLEWDLPESRIVESGIDHGVLFVDDKEGVPWNGLIGLKARSSGAEAKPVYIDGVKASNHAGVEEFLGTLEAYYYPREFEACDGVGFDPERSIGIGQQPRKPFHLAYRSWVDSAHPQIERGYKIHLLYNLYALPSSTTFQTRKETSELTPFSWDILSTPAPVPGYLPTSHLIFESNKLYLRSLQQLEEIIFGSLVVDSRMPTPAEVVQIVGDFLPVLLVSNNDTGFHEHEVLGLRDDRLEGDLVGMRNGMYYRPSSTRLIETATDGLYTLEA